MTVTWGTLLKHAGLALVVTVLANVGIAVAAKALLGTPPEFEPLATPIPTVIATTMYLVIGTITLFIVARFSKKPARTYWIIASIGLALSFIPSVLLAMNPESQPGTTNAGMAVLAAQHVVAFVIFVPWVTRVLGKARA